MLKMTESDQQQFNIIHSALISMWCYFRNRNDETTAKFHTKRNKFIKYFKTLHFAILSVDVESPLIAFLFE